MQHTSKEREDEKVETLMVTANAKCRVCKDQNKCLGIVHFSLEPRLGVDQAAINIK